MARQDSNPGGGARPIDAGLIPEPVNDEGFIARMNALRVKLFQDPSRVITAEFHLRADPDSWDDKTTLKYTSDPSNPDLWSMGLEDHTRITDDRERGVRKITANFGVRLDASGNPEGFAERIETLIGDSRRKANMTVDEIIGSDLDARLGQPNPPKRGGVAMMELVPDEEFPNDPSKTRMVTGSMSYYEGAVYLFGKDTADEMERKRKAKEDTVQAKKDSQREEQDALLQRKARTNGILNPDVFISFAELELQRGIKLTIYNGDNRYPDLWRVSIVVSSPQEEHKYHSVRFGFDTIPHPEWDDLAFKGTYVSSLILGVDPDPLKPVTGNEALARVDEVLDTYFPLPNQIQTPAEPLVPQTATPPDWEVELKS